MKSKIGTSAIIGKPFTPIVTTLSYTDLISMKNNNKSLEITNGIIFSIPQDNDGDIDGGGSIWLTDANGILYNLTKPTNQ